MGNVGMILVVVVAFGIIIPALVKRFLNKYPKAFGVVLIALGLALDVFSLIKWGIDGSPSGIILWLIMGTIWLIFGFVTLIV